MSDDRPARPALIVVRGEPTPAEIAALVTVLRARATADAAPRARRSAWADPARLVRRPVHPGPAGWRASAHPS